MKRKGKRRTWGMFAALGFAAAAALVTVILAGRIDSSMQQQELTILKDQVRRAAVNCYASEGRYPQNLDYLTEHYGLIYDEARYAIRYDAFASNIMPDIDVARRGEELP